MEKNKYTTGFKIPEGYFEEFDARMFEKLKEEVLPKDSGFRVPNHYFDGLEQKILQSEKTSTWKVLRAESPKNKISNKKTVLYALTGIAATLAIVLSLYPFDDTNSYSFEDLNETAVSTYIQDGELNLTIDDLAMYLQDEDFDALAVSSKTISEENLSEYLLKNLDDTTLLIK